MAEKWMKEAQEDYLNMKKECENQCLEIEKLKIPCENLKQETRQDFDQVGAASHFLPLPNKRIPYIPVYGLRVLIYGSNLSQYAKI